MNTKNQENQNSLSDFLDGPKRKKKNYIIIALEQGFSESIEKSIKNTVKSIPANYSIAIIKSSKELLKQTNKNISLIVISDKFTELDSLIDTIKFLKVKKHPLSLPILFFTNDYGLLIEKYHRKLIAYHESDDYIYIPSYKEPIFKNRVETLLSNSLHRRGRRYKVNEEISFFYLEKEKTVAGTIKDLSLYGALIVAKEPLLFSVNDQIRINIPCSKYLGYENGEFLKVSAKIRRVYISGVTFSVSFEYLSDQQIIRLTTLLTLLVNKSILATA